MALDASVLVAAMLAKRSYSKRGSWRGRQPAGEDAHRRAARVAAHVLAQERAEARDRLEGEDRQVPVPARQGEREEADVRAHVEDAVAVGDRMPCCR